MKGLKQQLEEANSEDYNKLTMEDLEKFLEELSTKPTPRDYVVPIEDLPELDDYNLKIYEEILDKIKEGYLYTFNDERFIYEEKRNFVLSTGCSGAIGFINSYKAQRIPANIVYDMITITDMEKDISAKLRDITWIKNEEDEK